MSNDPDPPRKFYGLKPRSFERVNEARPEAEPDKSPSPPPGSNGPIDVRDLNRIAAGEGPVLSASPAPRRENAVHALLRDNLEREKRAGLTEVAFRPARKSRRKRDYLFLMGSMNGALALIGLYALRTGNLIALASAIVGIGIVSASVTWIMWFVMDDY